MTDEGRDLRRRFELGSPSHPLFSELRDAAGDADLAMHRFRLEAASKLLV
jgi:hypothetical protein